MDFEFNNSKAIIENEKDYCDFDENHIGKHLNPIKKLNSTIKAFQKLFQLY